MNNPFPMTSGILGFVGSIGKEAYAERSIAGGVMAALLGYGMLPAAFILDFCIMMPLTILFFLTGQQEKD